MIKGIALFSLLCSFTILQGKSLAPFGINLGTKFNKSDFMVLNAQANNKDIMYRVIPPKQNPLYTDYSVTILPQNRAISMVTAIAGQNIPPEHMKLMRVEIETRYKKPAFSQAGDFFWAFKDGKKLTNQKTSEVAQVLLAGKVQNLPLADQVIWLKQDHRSHLAMITYIDFSMVRLAMQSAK